MGYDKSQERREKVIRSEVACKVLESHSEEREVMRFREQAKKEACAKQPVRKSTEKTIQNNQSPAASFISYLCSCSAGFSLWFSDKTLDAIREAGLTAWQSNSN